MKAEIKYYHSADVNDLDTYLPIEKDNFGISIEINVGPLNEEGDEIFGFVWCTPKWLIQKHKTDDVIWGRHYVIVFEYDFQNLRRKLEEYIGSLEEENWDALALKIGRIGMWEFEDYQP